MSADIVEQTVNAGTGEIIAEVTPEAARELTDRIKTVVGVAWELVKEAYESRAWAALGYSSWDVYCGSEFGSSRLALPREERREVVASLREAGLSARAIAAATGIPRSTIGDDLAAEVSGSGHLDDAEEADMGGKPSAALAALNAANDADKSKKITGTDGKSYNAKSDTAPTSDKSRLAVAGRIGKAKAMAKEGFTSRQISEALGMSTNSFASFKTSHGVEVPADKVTGRTRRLDSDRIVGESISTLEGVVMGLGLVEIDQLDPALVDGWATSLNDSLTALNRFRKQLKEMTQ